MGVFTIRPDNLSTITMAIGGDATPPATNYYVLDMDFNEEERSQILHATGPASHLIEVNPDSLVETNFRIIILGTSLSNCMQSLRTLKQAICSGMGYLEYRPVGLSASVMNTWYRYFPAPPPALEASGPGLIEGIAERYKLIHNDTYTHGVVVNIALFTAPLATSNPTTYNTILSQTQIDNGQSVVVDSSAIKGDFVIPTVRIEFLTGETGNARGVVMHKRRMRTTDNTDLDYFEGERFTASASNTGSTRDEGNVSNDYYRYYGDGGHSYYTFWGLMNGCDFTYSGKIAPILIARIDSTDAWELTLAMRDVGHGDLQSRDIAVPAGVSGWRVVYEGIDVMDFPPYPIPPRIAHSTFDTYIMNMELYMEANRISGMGSTFDIDFLVWANASDWIAVFDAESTFTPSYDIHVDVGGKFAYLGINPNNFDRPVKIIGSSLLRLVLEGGLDHRLRFVRFGADQSFNIADPMNITITGLHATVYPFEVA